MNKLRTGFARLKTVDKYMLAVVLVLVGVGVWRNFIHQPLPVCSSPGRAYELILKDGNFTQDHLTVALCDSVKVVNLDAADYQLAFGTHDKHVAFPGFRELTLRQNEFMTIDITQTGTYRLHDHLRDMAAVDLTVHPRD